MYDYISARADLHSYFLENRDDYLTAEEVEKRQRQELSELLGVWQEGNTSIWSLMWHLQHVMNLNYQLYFGKTIRFAERQKEEEIEESRVDLAPFINAEFTAPSYGPAVQEWLKNLRQQMETQSALTSFDITETILNVVLTPPLSTEEEEGGVQRWNPHTRLVKALYRVRERWEERKLEDTYGVKGTLTPEPVARTLARLAPYIDALRQSEPDPTCPRLLIKSMRVEPSGSGQIRPYAYNPDRLPPEAPRRLERDRWERLCEPGFFDPYAPDDRYDGTWEEGVYGTSVAFVTTYTVSFEPHTPEDLPALHELVTRAVRVLATVPPAFGIPRDYESTPYERPFVPAETPTDALNSPPPDQCDAWRHGVPGGCYSTLSLPVHCHVLPAQDQVKVYTKLDLDDALALYYLLEAFMRPDASTARSLNAARLAEGRSAPQEKDGADSYYDTSHTEPDVQLCDLSSTATPALVHGLAGTFTLFATGRIGEKAFVEQVVALAAHSLTGVVEDVTGTFPPLAHLIATASRDTSPVLNQHHPLTLRGTVQGRARAFLSMMADLSARFDLPLAEALREAAQEAHAPLIDAWQQENAASIAERFNQRWNNSSSSGQRLTDFFEECAMKVKDLEERNAHESADDSPSYALTSRTGLARRDPDVPPCLDRVYAGTLYTSRLPGSVFPRVELPPALEPFVREPQPGNPSSPLRLEDCRPSLIRSEMDVDTARPPSYRRPSPP